MESAEGLPFLSWHLLLLLGSEPTLATCSGTHPKFQISNVLWVEGIPEIGLYLCLFFKKATDPVLWKQSYKTSIKCNLSTGDDSGCEAAG